MARGVEEGSRGDHGQDSDLDNDFERQDFEYRRQGMDMAGFCAAQAV